MLAHLRGNLQLHGNRIQRERRRPWPFHVKDLTSRVSALETLLGQVRTRVQTIGTNFDSMAKTQDSLLREIQKHLAAIGGVAKSYSSDTQLVIGVKNDNLEGIKECLKKIAAVTMTVRSQLAHAADDGPVQADE